MSSFSEHPSQISCQSRQKKTIGLSFWPKVKTKTLRNNVIINQYGKEIKISGLNTNEIGDACGNIWSP